MEYRVWHSVEYFADYIIDKTILSEKKCEKRSLFESDAAKPHNFHTLPDHIKKIMYLDAPDIIVECNSEPIFSIEISTEAGTGHNVFQRFARLAAAVENDVPAIYIYPEAVIIERKAGKAGINVKWDTINPLIFNALSAVMDIYDIPALLFYYPSDYEEYKDKPICSPNYGSKGLRHESLLSDYFSSPSSMDEEMKKMFDILNEMICSFEKKGKASRNELLKKLIIREHTSWMREKMVERNVSSTMSPLSSTVEVPTEYILNYLSSYESEKYQIGELLRSRETSVLYYADAKFRADPYPGCLSAIDYMKCREGKTFEERKSNLILCWGKVKVDEKNKTILVESEKSSINNFIEAVQNSEKNNLLKKQMNELRNFEIPRYYMQVRYGSTYSKAKCIRVYSYFADAIIFKDGSLWRDA